jgi:hypothetical protein
MFWMPSAQYFIKIKNASQNKNAVFNVLLMIM